MNLSRDELLSQLREMDPYEFEELVADIWEYQGWETTVTTSSNDMGIDVIVKKESPFAQKHIIQAKRYKRANTVGSPDIQQYSSLRQQESNVDSVIVITTSSFTTGAKKISSELNVKLIDGLDLSDMILQSNTESILSSYQEIGCQTASKNRKNVESANESQPTDSPTEDFQRRNKQQTVGSSTSFWSKLIRSIDSPGSKFGQCPDCRTSSLSKKKSLFPSTYLCENCGAKLKHDWRGLGIVGRYKLTESDSELAGESFMHTEWMKLASNPSDGIGPEDYMLSRNSETIIAGDESIYFGKIESHGIKRKHAKTRDDSALPLINDGSCPSCSIGVKSKSTVSSNDPANCPLYEYEHVDSEYLIPYRHKLRNKIIKSKRIVGCESCKTVWVPEGIEQKAADIYPRRFDYIVFSGRDRSVEKHDS